MQCCQSECWTVKPYDHSDLRMFPTDYTSRKPIFRRNFAVGFSTRAKKKTGKVLQDYYTVFLIDESKTACDQCSSFLGYSQFSKVVLPVGIRQCIPSRGTVDTGGLLVFLNSGWLQMGKFHHLCKIEKQLALL